EVPAVEAAVEVAVEAEEPAAEAEAVAEVPAVEADVEVAVEAEEPAAEAEAVAEVPAVEAEEPAPEPEAVAEPVAVEESVVAEEPVTEPVAVEEPVGRPAKPDFTPGRPVTAYSADELLAVVRWIDADGTGRTDEELLRAAMKDLGFARLGPRIQVLVSLGSVVIGAMKRAALVALSGGATS
ncbi:hypothetical protein, partial [Kitasatospora sp. NPDC001683]